MSDGHIFPSWIRDATGAAFDREFANRCGDQMRGQFNGKARRASCVLAHGHAGQHDDELGTTWGERRDGHWLTFNADREIVGCHCGFRADMDADCGWGDSVVIHLIEVGVTLGRMAGPGDDSDIEAGRCCPHCRQMLTDHNRAVWGAGYAIGQRHARES